MESRWNLVGIQVESRWNMVGIQVESDWTRIHVDPSEFGRNGRNGRNLVGIWSESRSNLGGFSLT